MPKPIDWHCQIVRLERGSPEDQLVDEYVKNQRVFARRRRMNRAEAIRELLRSCIARKRKTLPEPEQTSLFAPLAPRPGKLFDSDDD